MHTFEQITNEYAGDSFQGIFYIVQDGESKNMVSASADWMFIEEDPRWADEYTVVLDENDAGVTVTVDQEEDAVIVEFETGTTTDMAGEFWHIIEVVDQNGLERKWIGKHELYDID